MLRNLTLNGDEFGEIDVGTYNGPTEFFCFEGPTALRDVITDIVFDDDEIVAVAFSRDWQWALGVPNDTIIASTKGENPETEVRIAEVPASIVKKLRQVAKEFTHV
jgi:hypothetical protein